MTAHATALVGLEFVRVEELHYGKLVAAKGGHVPMGEGYTTTYRTRGLLHPDRVLPTRLLEGALLQPEHIEEPFQRRGALFLRLVGETLVAMRARFRPEAGENRPGRTYLQASILQVDAPEGFVSVPPTLIPGFDKLLVADPDLITTPAAKRIGVGVPPRDEPFEPGPAVLLAEARGWGEMRQVRIAAIIEAMFRSAPIILGPDSFDDRNQSNDARLLDFLTDVGVALSVMAYRRKSVPRTFQVACGLSPEVAGQSLMLSSVLPSTRRLTIQWNDVEQMIEPTSPNGRGAARSAPRSGDSTTERPVPPKNKTFGQRATALGSSPQVLAPSQLPPPSASEPPANEPDALPGTVRPGWLDPSGDDSAFEWGNIHKAAELSCDHDLFENVGMGADPAAAIQAPIGGTVLYEFWAKFHAKHLKPSELFALAAGMPARTALQGWNPFKTSTPSPAHALLALLLGVQQRQDLLERFAFAEFFCIWPQLQKHASDIEYDYWAKQLIACMDQRISKLGTLTRSELELFNTYSGFWDHSELSSSTRKILSADSDYFQYTDLLSSYHSQSVTSGHDFGVDKKNILAGALSRVRWRDQKSSDADPGILLFSAFNVTPNESSISSLAEREDVAKESRRLLSGAVTAAQDSLFRFERLRLRS